ncbi:ankyrin repeat-containing domain protein, partial [Diaporthe sp. PMI_573]
DTGAFYLACVQGGDTLQACLASSDVDLNSPLPGRCGSNVFHEVLRIPADQFQDGKGEVLQLLLRSGTDPLAKNDLGDNILHILAGSTEPECHDLLSFLLEEKNDIADVRAACIQGLNQQNDFGDTPLIVAVLYNQLSPAEVLLRNGADMQIRGEFDMTAIEFAESRRYYDILGIL